MSRCSTTENREWLNTKKCNSLKSEITYFLLLVFVHPTRNLRQLLDKSKHKIQLLAWLQINTEHKKTTKKNKMHHLFYTECHVMLSFIFQSCISSIRTMHLYMDEMYVKRKQLRMHQIIIYTEIKIYYENRNKIHAHPNDSEYSLNLNSCLQHLLSVMTVASYDTIGSASASTSPLVCFRSSDQMLISWHNL